MQSSFSHYAASSPNLLTVMSMSIMLNAVMACKLINSRRVRVASE